MSQYPGGPPQDPYYGGYPPQQPSDPYFGGPPPPQDPYAPPPDPTYGQAPQGDPYYGQRGWYPPPPSPPPRRRSRGGRGGAGAAVVGLILVAIGVWILFGDRINVDLDWGHVWPYAAVVIGALMVLASIIQGRTEQD
jgi:hypothetical protein